MKILPNSLWLLAFLFLLSCDKKIEKAPESTATDSSLEEIIERGNPIDYDNTKVLSTVYAIAKNGVDAKQQADENAEIVKTYEYGERLEVIEETGEWLGVRDRISREFVEDGKTIQQSSWEKVYVLKNSTGSIEQIKIYSSDLYSSYFLEINNEVITVDTEKKIENHLTIELIDKDFFDSKKSTEVSFLLADTTQIIKKERVLELPCQNKTVTYVDKPDAEEDRQEYDYIGQVAFLNQYLISGSYYEGHDYRFIDKNTSEEIQFIDYPYISSDKKHIISIYTNPYETSADLELFTIADTQIKKTLYVSFNKWMPTVEPGDIFWSNDGYLYLSVNSVHTFWNADGNLNKKSQYIRIKVR